MEELGEWVEMQHSFKQDLEPSDPDRVPIQSWTDFRTSVSHDGLSSFHHMTDEIQTWQTVSWSEENPHFYLIPVEAQSFDSSVFSSTSGFLLFVAAAGFV